jgi:hypothetical protein
MQMRIKVTDTVVWLRIYVYSLIVSVFVLARAFRRSLAVQTFALHWAVFLSLLWTAFLWAVPLSLPLSAMNLERRVARDGFAYTQPEFQRHYGPNNWQNKWVESGGAAQPTVHHHRSPRSGSASQPTGDDDGSDWESAQLSLTRHHEAAVLLSQPPAL